VQDNWFIPDEQLKERLIEEYGRDDDSAAIRFIKDELYQRGYDHDEVDDLAIEALLRRIAGGNLFDDSLN
jgi:hypothetical protein